MIIGTAGHVDHGKTALVKALTGVDTDRLAEEKRRGITIELGLCLRRRHSASSTSPAMSVSCTHMFAGASGIDAALLVVALTEGIRPQTREHLQILSLLGIDHGVVALTMADLAPDRMPEVSASVRTLLADHRWRRRRCYRSRRSPGRVSTLRAPPLRASARPSRHGRLSAAGGRPGVTLSGAGLMVTGTLVSGASRWRTGWCCRPPASNCRSAGCTRRTGRRRGGRGAAGGPEHHRASALEGRGTRGDWVLHPEIHAPTAALDARMTLLADVARAMRQDTQVHLHLGAGHAMGGFLLDREWLEPGGSALVRLTLRQPIGALAGDRIVLRDTARDLSTIGGGVVLDSFPPRRGRRTQERLAQLAALEAPRPAIEALRGLLAVSPRIGRTTQPVHAGKEHPGGGSGTVDRRGARGGGRWADAVAAGVRRRARGDPGGAGRASSGVSRTAGIAERAAAAGAGDGGATTGGGVRRDLGRVAAGGRDRSGRSVVPAAGAPDLVVPAGRPAVARGSADDRGRAVPAAAGARYRDGAGGAGGE